MAGMKSPTGPGRSINLAAVLGKRGHATEAKRVARQEAESRDANAHRILGTDVVRDLDVDAARLLRTTLGGQLRAITLDDLRAFQAEATKLGKRYKGGITARGVIDHSLPVDRERANAEIRTAVVVRAEAGRLHFVTNAGPNSESIRHHVGVEFPSFKAYASSPSEPKKLARSMLDGPLRFECDCGRHRYWFRYIATKGGFCAGRLETGFPKIRNPKLVGVACKHALRVMQAVLKDANVRAKAAAMIAAGQKNDTRAQVTTAAEAKAQAEVQIRQAHHLKNTVQTGAQIAKRLSGTPAAKARALAAAAKEAQKRAARAAEKARKDIDAAMKKIAIAPMTRAQRDALIARLLSTKTID